MKTTLFLIVLALSSNSLEAQISKLGQFNIDKSRITTSGISSGAAMATQLHVVHSSLVSGSGSVAGPPYYCAQGLISYSTAACMLGTLAIGMSSIFSKVSSYTSSNLIDNPSNLRNHRVYLFSGQVDTVVATSVVKKGEEFFTNYMPGSSIKGVYNYAATHGMITDNYGVFCSIPNIFYINDCDYNQAYDILSHLNPGLNLIKPSKTQTPQGTYIRFDQTEFYPAGAPAALSMESYGFLYVPNNCFSGLCKLHVAFHGCGQSASSVSDVYVRNAGYNQVADLNNFIIVYPQTKPYGITTNPNGCWDWWGYTTPDYATKNGLQMRVVKAIIDRITG
jgi:hypothetical protein